MAHDELRQFIERSTRLFVLTGAGCSTDSGIPDYRDADGGWKRAQPVQYQSFMGEAAVRKRYWARSLVGWRRFRLARPNDTHYALATLEVRERLEVLVTQNVDGLHQAAGSRGVIDLHGRLDQVRCMSCERRLPRESFQRELLVLNPAWAWIEAQAAPDGDADLTGVDFESFEVPACCVCGGIMKPDVVFFGENVPPERVTAAMDALRRSDAVLVVGSSLMVYSGFRFVRAAGEVGKPVATVNLGRTRADEVSMLKVNQPCAQALRFLLDPDDAEARALA